MTQPNSWATISLWRRFFQLQEEEQQEEQREMEEILDEIFTAPVMRPIATEQNRALRAQVLDEHYRDLRAQQQRNEQELQQLNHPNLDVPVGDQYVTLAQ